MSCFVLTFLPFSLVIKPSLGCAKNEVFDMRMMCPVGLNAPLCCDYYGLPLCEIQKINKKLAWSVFIVTEMDCIFIFG